MPSSTLDERKEAEIRAKARQDLSDEQLKFFDVRPSANVLNMLVAVAGSGKSTTLARKIAITMIDPSVSNIVCLTSTNSAKNTLLTKINEALDSCGLSQEGYAFPPSNVRTIHSVALEENNKRLPSGRNKLKVVSSVTSMLQNIVDEVLDPYFLEYSEAASWDDYWDNAKHDAATKLAYEEELCPGKKCFMSRIGATGVKSVMSTAGFVEANERSLVDKLAKVRSEIFNRLGTFEDAGRPYDDIIRKLDMQMERSGIVDHCKSIKMFSDSGGAVCGGGDVLIIDEAQDCSRAQVKIVFTTLNAGACVIFVGDPSQGIMRFAGSESDPMRGMLGLAEKSGVVSNMYKLTTNFRSTSNIVRCSEAVLPQLDRRLRGSVNTLRQGSVVRLLKANCKGEEARLVANDVRAAIYQGRHPGDIAITRFKKITYDDDICVALKREGISYVILGVPRDKLNPLFRVLSFFRACVYSTAEDINEEVDDLEYAVHAVQNCTFSKDVKECVKEVAIRNGTSALEAFGNSSEMETALLRRNPHTFKKGKRTLNGEKMPDNHTRLNNMTKSISTFFTALHTAYECINRGLQGQCVESTDGMLVATSPMSRVVSFVYTRFLKVDHCRYSELSNLFLSLNALDTEASLDDFYDVIDREWSKLVNVDIDDVVVLSNFHKFKGKERGRVYCCSLNEKFDRCSLDQNLLATLEATHDKACSVPRTFDCKCPNFLLAKNAMEGEIRIERMRVCHVALSRARDEMVLSYGGCLSDIARPAFLQA